MHDAQNDHINLHKLIRHVLCHQIFQVIVWFIVCQKCLDEILIKFSSIVILTLVGHLKLKITIALAFY